MAKGKKAVSSSAAAATIQEANDNSTKGKKSNNQTKPSDDAKANEPNTRKKRTKDLVSSCFFLLLAKAFAICFAFPFILKTQPIKSKPSRFIGEFEVKEWQKTPKQLLHELCQKRKIPKPVYQSHMNQKTEQFAVKITIEPPKLPIVSITAPAHADKLFAEENAALEGLFAISSELPHDRTLPEPFRSRWGEMLDAHKQKKKLSASIEEEKKQEKKSINYIDEVDVRAKLSMGIDTLNLLQEALDSSGKLSTLLNSSGDLTLDKLLPKLSNIGFKSRHIHELQAVLHTKDQSTLSLENAIEWLLLKIPHSEIPESLRESSRQAKVHAPQSRLKNETSDSIAEDEFQRRGFPFSIVSYQRDDESNLDVIERAFSELYSFLGVPESHGSQDDVDDIEDEYLALSSIYGDDFSKTDDGSWTILHRFETGTIDPVQVTFKPFTSRPPYPLQVPIVLIDPIPGASKDDTWHPKRLYSLLRLTISSVAKDLELGSFLTHEIITALEASSLESASVASLVYPSSWLSNSVEEKVQQEEAIPETKSTSRMKTRKTKYPLTKNSERLQNVWSSLSPKKKTLTLPIHDHEESLISRIASEQVTVISAETGSGKSTQTGKFILESYITSSTGSTCMIACTQPRRISAVSLAERVSEEIGDSTGNLVGYRIRLESKVSKNTRLCFMTTGILLRYAIEDPYFSMFSHIIVDEVHERSQEIDFLLALLKNVVASNRRKDLKVILMSATLSAVSLIEYFQTGSVISIPGRTFPVTCYHLDEILQFSEETFSFRGPSGPHRLKGKVKSVKKEQLFAEGTYEESLAEKLSEIDEENVDPRLVVDLVWHIFFDFIIRKGMSGSILIFVPGVGEIQSLIRLIKRSIPHGQSMDSFWILPMHSLLTSSEQRKVFQTPPAGVQKIIVSTNIAEASVTIEDVVFVIDSGKMNQSEFDAERNMAMLVDSWISKANAKQRQGRAGRVREGICFRLFTQSKFKSLEDYQVPEIQRVSLDSLFLQVEFLRTKSKGFKQMFKSTSNFFQFLIDAPRPERINAARLSLVSVGALDEQHELTSLGSLIAQMSGLDVKLAKMLIYGSILRCLTPVLLIASFLSDRSPFLSPIDRREEATEVRKKFRCGESDHLTLVRAFDLWFRAYRVSEEKESQFCEEYFISSKSMRRAIGQVSQYLDTLRGVALLDTDLIHDSKAQAVDFCDLDWHSDLGQYLGTPGFFDSHSNNSRVLLAALCAALYPNVVKIVYPEARYAETSHGALKKEAEAKSIRYYVGRERVFLHPTCALFTHRKFSSPWMVYLQKRQTSKVFLYDCSVVGIYALVLLGGSIAIDYEKNLIRVGTDYVIDCPGKTAAILKAVREEFENLFDKKLNEEKADLWHSPVTKGLYHVLTYQGFDD